MWFLGPRFVGNGIPKILDTHFTIFKLHLRPSMWPILVEFRSASSEIKQRNKGKKKESVLKHKSTDRYVGRPNYSPAQKVSAKNDHLLLFFGHAMAVTETI